MMGNKKGMTLLEITILLVIGVIAIVIAYQLYNNISSKSVSSLDRVSDSFLLKNPSVLMERLDSRFDGKSAAELEKDDKKNVLNDYILLLRLASKDDELKSVINSYDNDIKIICGDTDPDIVRLCSRIDLYREITLKLPKLQ